LTVIIQCLSFLYCLRTNIIITLIKTRKVDNSIVVSVAIVLVYG